MDNNKSQILEFEKRWYESDFYINSGHWSSHPIFATRERHWLATETEKIRFYSFLAKYMKRKSYFGKARILIAPVGTGTEVKYLQGLYRELHGIDISNTALSMCPSHIMR